MNLDPSYAAGQPMYRRFLPDGRLSSDPPPPDASKPHLRHIVSAEEDPLASSEDPDIRALHDSIRWRWTASKDG